MAIMAMATVQKNKRCALALAFSLTPAISFAGDWNFEPSLTLDGTYSDNITLDAIDKTSSFVTQAGVKIEEEYSSKNASLDFNLHSIYAMYSHDRTLDSDYHTVNANGRFMLWPNGIALVATADISNVSRNSTRNSLADIISGDTVQVQHYASGFQYNIDNSDFKLNSSITVNRTISEDEIGNQQGYNGRVESTNGSQGRLVFWDMSGDYQYLENENQEGTLSRAEIKIGAITPYKFTPFLRFFDESNTGNINTGNTDLQSNSYGLGVRWLVNPRLFIDLSYNKPIDTKNDLDGNKLEEYVDAKVRWQPTERTILDATFSQRFYGNSYSLNLEHKNRRLNNTISYNESIKAFTRDRYEPVSQGIFWCPKGELVSASECFLKSDIDYNLDDFNLIQINNYQLVVDNAFSLNKTLSWQSLFELPRTTFSLSISGNERRSLETNIEDRNISASFSIKRKVSGYSDISLIASFADDVYGIATENERDNQYIRYSTEYIRHLNSTLDATFGISHLDRESSIAEDNYKEGRVYFMIKKGF